MTDPKPPSNRDEPQDQKWYERTRYQVLLFAGGIVLFGLVLWFVLDSYIDPKTSAQKKDLVQALGLITAGVAGAVGIFFTWRGQRITQRDQERNQRNTQEQLKNAQEQLRLTQQSQEQNQIATHAQLENAQEELRLTRQGQITERFTRAIDQLGNDENLAIRLGGIYALERIARESEQDHWPIMHTLTAYIREHAPWNPAQESSEEAPSRNLAIQATLTVLGRRPSSFGQGQVERIDLHKTDLREADLKGSNLVRANLAEANLRRVYLEGARLMEANLAEANLQGANLQGANLLRADLRAADLQSANLAKSELGGAKFRRAELAQADISGANLAAARDLTQEQIERAHGNGDTRLPHHLVAPAAWGKQPDHRPIGDLA